LFFIVLLLTHCDSPESIDYEALSIELDSIYKTDQKYRMMLDSVGKMYGANSPELRNLWQKQQEIDEANVIRILEIIDEVGGYPGPSMVGSKAGTATFFVLQHAPDSIQEQYYEMIVQAGIDNELKDGLVAMYRDRYLMHRGEPQIFGTQVRINYQTDSITGVKTEHAYIWPIADTTNIDSLRMWNGLGSLEEYLNQFGISRWDK